MKSLVDKTNLLKERAKRIENNIRSLFIFIFAVSLMVSVGYLLYTFYEIYHVNLKSLNSIMEVWYYMGKNAVAFEACIVSFLLLIAAIKI